MLPLYEETQIGAPTLGRDGHAGLWFERFFDRYDRDWGVGKAVKQPWLKQHFAGKTLGDRDALQQFALQQLALLNTLNGQAQVYETDGHFVTGMGNPHPVENGLSWHPTAAVPYLSGAAVKGLVRSWLEVWQPQADQAVQKQPLLSWFGSDHKDPKQQSTDSLAGQLIFFDAIPIKPVNMQVDIMTPHMGKWYQQGADITRVATQPERIPADWHNPVPVPFLVVKQAQFLFTVAKRDTDAAGLIDLDTVMQALEQALQWLGAGAKTAVGYGQMHAKPMALQGLQDAVDQQIITGKKTQALEKMTPLERELVELCDKADNAPVALQQKLVSGHWQSPEDQRVVAEKAKALWQALKKWNPDYEGKNKQKVKQRDRCLVLQQYLN